MWTLYDTHELTTVPGNTEDKHGSRPPHPLSSLRAGVLSVLTSAFLPIWKGAGRDGGEIKIKGRPVKSWRSLQTQYRKEQTSQEEDPDVY